MSFAAKFCWLSGGRHKARPKARVRLWKAIFLLFLNQVIPVQCATCCLWSWTAKSITYVLDGFCPVFYLPERSTYFSRVWVSSFTFGEKDEVDSREDWDEDRWKLLVMVSRLLGLWFLAAVLLSTKTPSSDTVADPPRMAVWLFINASESMRPTPEQQLELVPIPPAGPPPFSFSLPLGKSLCSQ